MDNTSFIQGMTRTANRIETPETLQAKGMVKSADDMREWGIDRELFFYIGKHCWKVLIYNGRDGIQRRSLPHKIF